jgi:hypothetical protein
MRQPQAIQVPTWPALGFTTYGCCAAAWGGGGGKGWAGAGGAGGGGESIEVGQRRGMEVDRLGYFRQEWHLYDAMSLMYKALGETACAGSTLSELVHR